jgi:hypothetical protein
MRKKVRNLEVGNLDLLLSWNNAVTLFCQNYTAQVRYGGQYFIGHRKFKTKSFLGV